MGGGNRREMREDKMDQFLLTVILIAVFIIIIIVIVAIILGTSTSATVVLPPVTPSPINPPINRPSAITYGTIFNLTAPGTTRGPIIRCTNRNSCGDRAILGSAGSGINSERFRFIALNGTAGPVRFGDNVRISVVTGGYLELCAGATNQCGAELVLGGNSSGTIWRIDTLTGDLGTVVNNTNQLALTTVINGELVYLTTCDELAFGTCNGTAPVIASRRVNNLFWRIDSVP